MSNKLSTNFNKIITLDKADAHKKYIIVNCKLTNELKVRFAELGLTVGARITVLKRAPLGDPLEIVARGYSLCLRKAEASAFEIREELND